MVASIRINSEFFGVTATLCGFALLVIWGLFIILGIKINRRGIRLFGTGLVCVSLSILLGLWQTDIPQEGRLPGGIFGNWVYVNVKIAGMVAIAVLLAWVATIAAALLATDWFFLDYVLDALGLRTETSPGKFKIASAYIKSKSFGGKRFSSPVKPKSTKPVSMASVPRTQGITGGRAEDTFQETGTALLESLSTKSTPPTQESLAHSISTHEKKKEPSSSESSLSSKKWWALAEEENPSTAIDGIGTVTAGAQDVNESDESIESSIDTEEIRLESESWPEPLQEEEVIPPSEEEQLSIEEDAWMYSQSLDLIPTENPSITEEESLILPAGDREMSVTEESPEPIETSPSSAIREERPRTKEGVSVKNKVEEKEEPEHRTMEIEPEFSEEKGQEDSNAETLSMAQEELEENEWSLFKQAALGVTQEGTVSISFLQKNLGIGYFKAAKVLDQLEKRGIITPPEGDGSREINFTREQLAEFLNMP